MPEKSTITFLFTDIVSSTELVGELGDDSAEAIFDRHFAQLREAVAAFHGEEVQSLGDGLLISFKSAADAVGCAVQMQRAVAADDEPLGLRVGLHAGDAAEGSVDFRGMPVVIARRLCDRANGGQILTSELVRELAGTRGSHTYVTLGVLKLKGVRAELPVCEVPWRDDATGVGVSEGDSRARGALPRFSAGGLPRPLTAFVGRVAELEKLSEMLARTRLVTLTGPGGTGKTRLAIEAARKLEDRFEAGAAFVDLAPLSDPELVAGAVAQAVGVREQPGVSVLDSLTGALASRHLLLVLDNCEHLLGACGDLVEALLQASDDVRILSTSREPLGVAGERRYALPALPVPPVKRSDARLDDYPAVTLFEQRARDADPDFALTAESEPAIATLVRRLDGMPLAIELAAARVDVLGLDQLMRGIDQPLKMLVSDSNRPMKRQHSLRATIDWSYELLSEPEQCVFRALSVFPGPFTLDAAVAVTCEQAAEIVPRLVRRSLLTLPELGVDGSTRYGCLQTLRAYAAGKLTAANEVDGVFTNAAAWTLHAAEALAGGYPCVGHLLPPHARGSDAALAARWMDSERDNLHGALQWLLPNDPDGALRLALCLSPWWNLRSLHGEAELTLRQVLDGAADAPTELAAAAELWLGRHAEAATVFADAIALCRKVTERVERQGPSEILVDAMTGQIGPLLNTGRGAEAMRISMRAQEMARTLEYASGQVKALSGLAMIALYQGDFPGALKWAEAANAADLGPLSYDAERERDGILVHALEGVGDFDRAEEQAKRLLEIRRQENAPISAAFLLDNLARIALQTGRREDAAAYLKDELELIAQTGERWPVYGAILNTSVWAQDDHPEDTATLWGALAALAQAMGVAEHEDLSEELFLAEPRRRLEHELGLERVARLERRGSEMMPAAALELAEALLSTSTEPLTDEAAARSKLTRRERELLALLADGLTSAQIAERLFVSVKTVHSHLDRIQDKTGARLRPELTRLALAVVTDDSVSG